MRKSAQFRNASPPSTRPTDRRALAPLRSPKLLDDDDKKVSPPEKKHSDDGSPLRPSQAPGYDQALSEQSMGMTSGIRAKRDEPYDSTRDS